MRYYVLLDGMWNGITRPYIVAETVSERGDDGSQRDGSLAAVLAGPRARIVTEFELPDISGGTEALAAWRADDDDGYGAESDDLDAAAAGEARPQGPPGALATVTQLRPRRRRHPATRA
jgi:hypothetical protein